MLVSGAKKIVVIIAAITIILMILIFFYNLITKTVPSTTTSTPSIVPTTYQYPTNVPAWKLQQKADDNWGKKAVEVEKTYPWLDQLPLQTADYFVYFDINKKNFVAKIFNKEKTTSLKEEITTKLKDLGINSSDFSFNWQ